MKNQGHLPLSPGLLLHHPDDAVYSASSTLWFCAGCSESIDLEMTSHVALEGSRPSLADCPKGFSLSSVDILGQIILSQGGLPRVWWDVQQHARPASVR